MMMTLTRIKKIGENDDDDKDDNDSAKAGG